MVEASLGSPPKKLIRPPTAASSSACSWTAAHRHRGDDDVGAEPVGHLQHALAEVLRRWVDADGRAELLRVGAAARVRLGDDHLGGAGGAARSSTCRSPIGPAPQTSTVIALGERHRALAAQTQASGSTTETAAGSASAGTGMQVAGRDGGGRHVHVLGERAVERDAEGVGVRAQVHAPGSARRADAAAEIRRDEHALPDRRALDAGADRDDLARDLVARDAPRALRIGAVRALGDPQVGAADAGGEDADHRLAATRRRLRPVLDLEPAGPVVDERAHHTAASASSTGRPSCQERLAATTASTARLPSQPADRRAPCRLRAASTNASISRT